MYKKLVFTFAALTLLISACAPKDAGKTPTPAQTQPATQAAQVGTTLAPAGSECTLISALPTPGPTIASLFPAVSVDDWTNGPADAQVTFLEYSDFQCPFCAEFAAVVKQLQAQYPEDVRVAFRHFPLISLHPLAPLASQAAEAAGIQGKFWEMHDALFENQAAWGDPANPLSVEDFETWLAEQAQQLELDEAKFSADLNSPAVVDKVQKAREYGESIGLPGTPFILVNGSIWQGPMDLQNLGNLVNVAMLQEKQFTGCPPMQIDPAKQYLATLKTDKGDIVIQLYPDKAPFTVNSFVFLSRNDWYDNVSFHRVVDNPAVAQAGDPTGTGWGGPGYAFIDEIDETLTFDRAGIVAMANSGPDTNGSQFFIARSPLEFLNGGYTIFGEVIEGMDVVESLTKRDPQAVGVLPVGSLILDVVIEEK